VNFQPSIDGGFALAPRFNGTSDRLAFTNNTGTAARNATGLLGEVNDAFGVSRGRRMSLILRSRSAPRRIRRRALRDNDDQDLRYALSRVNPASRFSDLAIRPLGIKPPLPAKTHWFQ